MAVSVIVGLGALFVCLSFYDVMASSPVAKGPKRPKKWSALTKEVAFESFRISTVATSRLAATLSSRHTRLWCHCPRLGVNAP
jgi:hypothetical protein